VPRAWSHGGGDGVLAWGGGRAAVGRPHRGRHAAGWRACHCAAAGAAAARGGSGAWRGRWQSVGATGVPRPLRGVSTDPAARASFPSCPLVFVSRVARRGERRHDRHRRPPRRCAAARTRYGFCVRRAVAGGPAETLRSQHRHCDGGRRCDPWVPRPPRQRAHHVVGRSILDGTAPPPRPQPAVR